MPYFAIYALDAPGALPRREAVRERHRAYLRTPHADGTVGVLGGPLTDDAGAMIGTLVVLRAPSRAAAERFLAGDPYTEAAIFERVEVRAWRWGLGAPAEDADPRAAASLAGAGDDAEPDDLSR
jgi:uncharacterized protein YciI